YTLGSTFPTQGRYGRFIFWSDPTTPQGSPVCEIISKDGNFWMTPLGEIPLFLNNVESKEPTKLKDGDELSLKNVEEGQNSGCPAGSLKFTILSEILSHLNLHELKVARLVAYDWNQEAIRHIKKRAAANFRFCYKTTSSKHVSLDQFSRYTREMENFPPLENWSFTFPEFGINSPQLRAELKQFLGQSHQIKKLKLGGTMKSPFDYKVCHKFIEKLAGSLQHLELFGFWQFVPTTENSSPPSLISDLTKLEVFSVSVTILAPSMLMLTRNLVAILDFWDEIIASPSSQMSFYFNFYHAFGKF
ncbi:hypothetical protein Fcan01_20858, partial [Folsomia candida]